MATRWVIHEDELGQVDTEPLMRHLADEIADDMRKFVPVDKGHLRDGIRVGAVTDDIAFVVSTRPESGEDREEVPVYVEQGTSDTRAQPYMRPATYIYRTP